VELSSRFVFKSAKHKTRGLAVTARSSSVSGVHSTSERERERERERDI